MLPDDDTMRSRLLDLWDRVTAGEVKPSELKQYKDVAEIMASLSSCELNSAKAENYRAHSVAIIERSTRLLGSGDGGNTPELPKDCDA